MENIKKQKFVYIALAVLVCIICLIICIFKENHAEENFEYVENNNVYEEEKTSQEVEELYVYVVGEVKNPGIIKAYEGARIGDIIDLAGGFTENADKTKINLAYKVSDGQKLIVPSVSDDDENYISQDAGENIITGEGSAGAKININVATQTELETLDGIGPSMASKIIQYRQMNGKFKSVEEIKKVPGIGESKYKIIEDKIKVK